MQLKTAVIGLGMGLNYHVPAIINHPGFLLTAVADPDVQKLQSAKEKYQVKGYTDAYAMMDQEALDLVVVASPHNFHLPHTLGAFERGIDVFLEKPMANHMAEALEIKAAQEKTGRKLMVYQPQRVMPDTEAVRQLLDSQLLGKIYMIKRTMSSFFVRTNWKAYLNQGGGTLNIHGAHYIDLLLHLTNSKAKKVFSKLMTVRTPGDADDCARVTIETDHNIVLDIDMLMVTSVTVNPWMIFGENGTAVQLQTQDGQQVIRARYLDPAHDVQHQQYYPVSAINDRAASPWLERDFSIAQERSIDFYDKCYAYYALDETPFVPLEETLAVMEIMDQCHAQNSGS